MTIASFEDEARCTRCGYAVSGVPAGDETKPTCPECGHVGVWRPHMRLRPTMRQRWWSLGLALVPGVICTGVVALAIGADASKLVFLSVLGMPSFIVLGLVLFARGTDPRIVPGIVVGAGLPSLLVTMLAWFGSTRPWTRGRPWGSWLSTGCYAPSSGVDLERRSSVIDSAGVDSQRIQGTANLDGALEISAEGHRRVARPSAFRFVSRAVPSLRARDRGQQSEWRLIRAWPITGRHGRPEQAQVHAQLPAMVIQVVEHDAAQEGNALHRHHDAPLG